MAGLRVVPVSRVDLESLLPLFEEEGAAWLAELRWDYSPIRQILVSLARRRLLPGYAALDRAHRAVAYSYFLVTGSKGVIGALYASRDLPPEEPLDRLLALTVDGMKETSAIRRVEAQIMPFHRRDPTEEFLRRDFRHYPRHVLERPLAPGDENHAPAAAAIIPWVPSRLEDAGEMTLAAYREQTDAEICADYGTRGGCVAYLRSLVGNPGCGIFMPEASFMASTPRPLRLHRLQPHFHPPRDDPPDRRHPRASTRGWATPDGAHPGPAARRRLPLGKPDRHRAQHARLGMVPPARLPPACGSSPMSGSAESH